MNLVNVADLFSWQYAKSSRILTVYAVDKPLPEIGAYVFNDTISGAINDTTILNWVAWGTDTSGHDFFVLYGGAAEGTLYFEPEIDIFSRADGGVSDTTLDSIIYCFGNVGISELNGLVAKVYKTNFDGRRVGMPPTSCNETCMQNENSS